MKAHLKVSHLDVHCPAGTSVDSIGCMQKELLKENKGQFFNKHYNCGHNHCVSQALLWLFFIFTIKHFLKWGHKYC